MQQFDKGGCDNISRDLIGMKFGRLTVVNQASPQVDKRGYKRTMWKCQCDCGKKVVVREDSLTTPNHTRSCGCLQKDIVSEIGEKTGKRIKYGESRERLHNIWYLMRYRCENEKSPAYKNYGGRGINVCEEWANDLDGYLNFKNWALSNGYCENLTIDRINNNSNYEPSNCRWVDSGVQNKNKRNTIFMELNHIVRPLTEWSQITGISAKNLYRRRKLGWSDERALTQPLSANTNTQQVALTQLTIKNRICGEMKICGLGAAQATATGKVADSAKIGRNASTIALITDKTPEEIEIDGPECGNKKMQIVLNRNGMQHAPGEYISLQFNGNLISYEEAKQAIPIDPF